MLRGNQDMDDFYIAAELDWEEAFIERHGRPPTQDERNEFVLGPIEIKVRERLAELSDVETG